MGIYTGGGPADMPARRRVTGKAGMKPPGNGEIPGLGTVIVKRKSEYDE